jgi:competence transcription factor ComK
MFNKSSLTAKRVIKDEYGDSKNMMADKVVDHILTDNYAVEVSQGRGIVDRSRKFYGLSVVERDGESAIERCTDKATTFETLDDVYDYIRSLD